MKTYNFNIYKYHVTITIEKKNFKPVDVDKHTDNKIAHASWLESVASDGLFEHGRNNGYPFTPNEIRETLGINEPTGKIKMEEKASDLCVLEAAEKYIQAKRGKLADSTRKGYMNIVDNHLSGIWLYRLDRLTEEHLQETFDAEIAKGLSVKTLKGYRSFILKVLAEYRPDFHPNIRVTKEGVNETSKT